VVKDKIAAILKSKKQGVNNALLSFLIVNNIPLISIAKLDAILIFIKNQIYIGDIMGKLNYVYCLLVILIFNECAGMRKASIDRKKELLEEMKRRLSVESSSDEEESASFIDQSVDLSDDEGVPDIPVLNPILHQESDVDSQGEENQSQVSETKNDVSSYFIKNLNCERVCLAFIGIMFVFKKLFDHYTKSDKECIDTE